MSRGSLSVLFTSVGNDGFISVYRALKHHQSEREIRMIGVDCRENAYGLFVADKGHVIVKRDSERHFPQLLELIGKYGIDVFFPLSTRDQEFYSLNVDSIPVPTVVGKHESLVVANDKFKLMRHLQENGLGKLVPRHHKVADIDGVREALMSLGYPEKKVVYKIDNGTGAQGLKILDASTTGLQRLIDRDNKVLRADEFLSWLQGNENRMPDAHMVEYLEGEEYSVDTLSIEGKVLKAVVRRRLSSIYGIATEAVVENDPKAEQAACEICESLRLDYVSNIQFRKDGNGDLKIMEINPRIPGTIGLTVNAGVNMPYLALKLLLREEVNIPPVEYGKRILRFWDGIYI